ncbi:hypothetical protein DK2_00007 [Bacillus phage DK2]|uniref:Uncharacterized protein n=1 Tax=Bacillus phage DK2 TaxID=2500809 RepID=A0A3T0IIY6_9CAUD|nr:hypothetical protein H3017_gp07 [Bacillus phage DK2]AZU99760.1 hypothetical protein DK2_00007 [Bacillus phage DK2]
MRKLTCNLGMKWVGEDDYLKVVEEKELLKIGQDNGIKEVCKLNRELLEQDNLMKEKDEVIERLDKENKFHNNEFKRLSQYILNNNYQNGKLLIVDSIIAQCEIFDKENQGLSIRCESLEEEVEGLRKENIEMIKTIKTNDKKDTYTLSYSYLGSDGVTIKNYRQSGLLKEEYEEMYGMDSDNWLSHSLVKDRKEVL